MANNRDKFRPDWITGTLTITIGSDVFTATDAELLLAAIHEGDMIITTSGLVLPIVTIDADGNGGTIAFNSPETLTFPTRIRYQSDNSRYTGTLQVIANMLESGNVQSLSALEGLADKLLMFNAPGVLALIDKSEVGIQDPNQSLAKLAALLSVSNLEELAQLDSVANLEELSFLASVTNLESLANLDDVDNLSSIAGWTSSQVESASSAISFIAQTLTEAQQGQARDNIGAINSARVRTEVASFDTSSVGTYIFARRGSGTGQSLPGALVAGSGLVATSAFMMLRINALGFNTSLVGTNIGAGTWRCMGHYGGDAAGPSGEMHSATLWLRIS